MTLDVGLHGGAPMDQIVPYFIREGIRWVASQRDLLRPLGRKLSEKEWTSLAPYFTANTLDEVVVHEVELIENPDFYPALVASGQPIPIDFSQMAGITYIDTIVLGKQRLQPGWEAWLSLLFHECVHVCQYNHLGLPSFMEQYVEGWAHNGFNYYAIPLEAHAYSLQDQFDQPGPVFSVEDSVESSFTRKI